MRTLNATLKRKKNHRRTPDVRSFFQTEFPENKVFRFLELIDGEIFSYLTC